MQPHTSSVIHRSVHLKPPDTTGAFSLHAVNTWWAPDWLFSQMPRWVLVVKKQEAHDVTVQRVLAAPMHVQAWAISSGADKTIGFLQRRRQFLGVSGGRPCCKIQMLWWECITSDSPGPSPSVRQLSSAFQELLTDTDTLIMRKKKGWFWRRVWYVRKIPQ